LATSEWITPTDAALRLLDVNVESGGAIDFLVASTGPGPRLVLVREGQTPDVSTEAWIGDAEAAHVFERLKSTTDVPPGTPPERENLIRSLDAFSAVLEAPEAPTVAGLKMRVDLAPAGFVYLDGALAYCPRQTIPSGVATTLQFGGPAQGGFAYTILVPEQPGVAIVAVHFYQGRLGYVYAPLQADRPVKVPDVDHDGLQAYVGEQFGVQVLGLKIG
jgi:hypothetical protein